MVEFKIEENKLVCTFSGSLHTANCQELEKKLSPEVDKFKGPVIFDMADVKYIASTFLRICTRTFKKIGMDNFSVINVSPSVKEIFTIAGMTMLLKD